MSKIQSDRQEDIQFARQTDRVTEIQNDSMVDSRAAKEPALVYMNFGFLKIKKNETDNFHPHVSGSVAVRLTITANLYLLLYPLSQHITLKSTGSKTVIYQR